ncbi:lipopolysaccharide biosynthesis protein [Vibrio maerlii]|uniref:lipopolysaccharide biosynthesis protein n=1 Tax=Vibrio maerlii TaxID=2231648 RepID=UPI000E3C3A88|nr:oligosaccharide flippase family protein [Vibrio maerlii]
MLRALTTSPQVSRLISLSVITGVFKLSSALATILLTFMITNTVGAESTGQFFYIYNLTFLLAMFSMRGFNVSLLKFNAIAYKQESSAQLKSHYSYALARVIFLSLTLSIAIYLTAPHLNEWISSSVVTKERLQLAAYTLPLLTFSLFHAACLQSISKIISSVLSMQLGISSLLILMLLIFHNHDVIDSGDLLTGFLTASLIFAAFSSYQWWRNSGVTAISPFGLKNPDLKSSAKKLWISNTITNLTQWGGLVIAGFFVSAADLGLLSAAQRASLLIGFVLITVNFVVAPTFSTLYKEGRINELIRVSRLIFRSSLAIGLIPSALFLLYPDWVMTWFGPDFFDGSNLLMILTFGQLINISTGSVGYLLIMSGHENEFKTISIISGIVNLICLTSFSWLWGVTGAALAMALSMIVSNALALRASKRHLGFYPIG